MMNLARATVLVLTVLFGAHCFAGATYTYDSLGRLTMVLYGNGTTISYSYDAAGNRNSQNVSVPPAIAVVMGTPQIALVNTAFSQALKVKVTDNLGNATVGATVVFTPPASGASASCTSPATTDANGMTQTTCTANGTTGSYLVSAAASGIATPALFALTNYQGASGTSTLLGISDNPAIYATIVTLTATVGGTTPAGTVDFMNGGVSISGCSAQPVAGGQATCLTSSLALGSNNLTAIYSGDGPNPAGTSAILTVQVYSLFDVDANGQVDAFTDGVLILRYLFGLTGTSLTNGAVGAGAQRGAAQDIAAYLLAAGLLLDVDGNLQADALTDGLLIFRYLGGLRGAALIEGVVGATPSRPTASAIEDYFGGFLP